MKNDNENEKKMRLKERRNWENKKNMISMKNSHWMKEIKKAKSAKPRNERKDEEKAKNKKRKNWNEKKNESGHERN